MLKRMQRRLITARGRRVEFCDACASVCDARCRARELRADQRTRAALAATRW